MDSNDEIARLARQALVQRRRHPRLREFDALRGPVVRLLAEGRPVSLDQIAEALGWPAARVAHILRGSPDTEWTATGLLSGMCLTLRTTPHRLTVGGDRLHAWCAVHGLMVPVLLGKAARLESPCRVTGTPIEVDISAHGYARTEPDTAVVAVRTVASEVTEGITPTCVYQALFRNVEIAKWWLEDHPDHRIFTVRDAARYVRLIAPY